MGMDLSYLEALMGGAAEEAGGGAGGVWVVSPEGALSDGILRLVGKARVVADALGAYVYLLLAGDAAGGPDPARAIGAGADHVLTAAGTPTLTDLVDFCRERAPQVILLPHTRAGRTLGPGLAEVLGGGLCAYAADLAVDPIYGRVVAHQPILDDAARRAVSVIGSPAVVVMDTAALPAAFDEPWRSGNVEATGLVWPAAESYPPAEVPAGAPTLTSAEVVVAAGRGLADFTLAGRLAEALGGVVAGDVGALDAGWITEAQLVGLTGQAVAPKLYLALGIRGDTGHLMAIEGAGTIVAVQRDPAAAIVPVADYNILADPAGFAAALLAALAE